VQQSISFNGLYPAGIASDNGPLLNSAQDTAMNPSNPRPVAGTAAKIGGYGVLGLFVAWSIIKRASRTGYLIGLPTWRRA
jgi:hypothetical protein